mgnify:CR=1 FL=1
MCNLTCRLHKNLQVVFSAQFIAQSCLKQKWLSLGSYLLPPKDFVLPNGVLRGTNSYLRPPTTTETNKNQNVKKRRRRSLSTSLSPARKKRATESHEDYDEPLRSAQTLPMKETLDNSPVTEYTPVTTHSNTVDIEMDHITTTVIDLRSSDCDSEESLHLCYDEPESPGAESDNEFRASDRRRSPVQRRSPMPQPEELATPEYQAPDPLYVSPIISLQESDCTRAEPMPQRTIVEIENSTAPSPPHSLANSPNFVEDDEDFIQIWGLDTDSNVPIVANVKLQDSEEGFLEFDLENDFDSISRV